MRVCVAWACLAALAFAEGETKRYTSADGKHSLELPVAWDGAAEKADKTVLAIRGKLPGERASVLLRVVRSEGIRNLRSAFFSDRAQRIEQDRPKTIEAVMAPFPYLWMVLPDRNGDFVHVRTLHIVRRVGFTIMAEVTPPSAWEPAKEQILKAFASFQADIEEWPARPKDFVETVKDGYVYLRHPDLRKTEVTRIHKLVKRLEQDFAKRYGPSDKPAGNQPQIVIYKTRDDMPNRSATGYHVEWSEGRLYAYPLPEKELQAEVYLSQAIVALLTVQRLGVRCPRWIYTTEHMTVASEVITGKKFPWMAKSIYQELPAELPAFAVILDPKAKAPAPAKFCYGALFRSGPAKYRKAWKACLKDFRATGDWEAAIRAHLLTLDAGDLQDAAFAHMRKFKVPPH